MTIATKLTLPFINVKVLGYIIVKCSFTYSGETEREMGIRARCRRDTCHQFGAAIHRYQSVGQWHGAASQMGSDARQARRPCDYKGQAPGWWQVDIIYMWVYIYVCIYVCVCIYIGYTYMYMYLKKQLTAQLSLDK